MGGPCLPLGEAWGLLRANCGCAARGGRATCPAGAGRVWPVCPGSRDLQARQLAGRLGANASAVSKHNSGASAGRPRGAGSPKVLCPKGVLTRRLWKVKRSGPGVPSRPTRDGEGSPCVVSWRHVKPVEGRPLSY